MIDDTLIGTDKTDDGWVLSFYPWDHGMKPYFVSPEGFEWYVDKSVTQFAQHDDALWGGGTRKGLKNLVAFYVRRGNEIKNILIDDEQNIVAVANSSCGLYDKVLQLKVHEDFLEKETEMEKKERLDRNIYADVVSDFLGEKVKRERIYSKPDLIRY